MNSVILLEVYDVIHYLNETTEKLLFLILETL